MIDLQRFHHYGMAVADIDAAQTMFAKALNLRFAPVRNFDPFPFWTPEQGTHVVNVFATYSIEGPVRLELVQGTGPFYDPGRLPDARHVGLWVDDVAAEAGILAAQGWSTIASGAAPDDGWGVIAYMSPPVPGLLVELISMSLKPVIDEWTAE